MARFTIQLMEKKLPLLVPIDKILKEKYVFLFTKETLSVLFENETWGNAVLLNVFAQEMAVLAKNAFV